MSNNNKSIETRCDLANMARNASKYIDTKRDHRAGLYRGVLEQLAEHIDEVRTGKVSPGEFCRFYMIERTEVQA